MARILMKWTLICSDCEKFLVLAPAMKVPKRCPNCDVEFESETNQTVSNSEKDETFIPSVEKILSKVPKL